jgi:hypothetical protein
MSHPVRLDDLETYLRKVKRECGNGTDLERYIKRSLSLFDDVERLVQWRCQRRDCLGSGESRRGSRASAWRTPDSLQVDGSRLPSNRIV